MNIEKNPVIEELRSRMKELDWIVDKALTEKNELLAKLVNEIEKALNYPPAFEAFWEEHQASPDYVLTVADKQRALAGWLAREKLFNET